MEGTQATRGRCSVSRCPSSSNSVSVINKYSFICLFLLDAFVSGQAIHFFLSLVFCPEQVGSCSHSLHAVCYTRHLFSFSLWLIFGTPPLQHTQNQLRLLLSNIIVGRTLAVIIVVTIVVNYSLCSSSNLCFFFFFWSVIKMPSCRFRLQVVELFNLLTVIAGL